MVRAYTAYGLSGLIVPQTMPIPGREAQMVRNNAGGYGFKIDKWQRLSRFLILGSEGGTYYVKEQKLTAENAACVIACIAEDGVRVVEEAFEVNDQNRSPKTDQQLFALALALKHGDQATKNAVRKRAPAMLRIGTHLLHFAAMLDSMGGWNRSKRRVIKNWLADNDSERLAFQMLKYQSRDGWSMRDVLRVIHPKAPDVQHAAVYDWACGRNGLFENWPELLQVNAAMKTCIEDMGASSVLSAIDQGLPREAVPTEYLTDVAVTRALLPRMGLHAVLRNLGNLTANNTLLTGSTDTEVVAERLTNYDAIRRARVHPFAVLLAGLVYGGGTGFRSTKTWKPIRRIVEALDDAYELAFQLLPPNKKRSLIVIDTSGSMDMQCQGTPIPVTVAAAAMALTLARQEPYATVIEADTEFQRVVPVTKRSSISSLNIKRGGGTDLSAGVRWAATHQEKYDVIVILTDNETWAGRYHCTHVLQDYRAEIAPDCKLVVAAMAANHASVVDQDDPLQLGCSGLDANLPAIINDFITH